MAYHLLKVNNAKAVLVEKKGVLLFKSLLEGYRGSYVSQVYLSESECSRATGARVRSLRYHWPAL